MSKHCMLDLETLGNGNEAVILSIGAVCFDETGLGAEFYTNVNPQSCVEAGLKMDVSTVVWWMKQDDQARSAFNKPGVSITQALMEFSEFFRTNGCEKLWGNGATFDNVILRSAYRLADRPTPWEYYNDMCYRTLKNLRRDIKMERWGTHHNALDDAKSQAAHAINILKELNK